MVTELISDQFDWSETRPCSAVVRLTSVARDCEPTALAPLSEAVDTDALDALLRSADSEVTLRFTYAGLQVQLRGDGTAAVEPRT